MPASCLKVIGGVGGVVVVNKILAAAQCPNFPLPFWILALDLARACQSKKGFKSLSVGEWLSW